MANALITYDFQHFEFEPSYDVKSDALIEKQAKNRNETGSTLSLATRLTVLSKRLGRKSCCDTTPDRCLELTRFTILTLHC